MDKKNIIIVAVIVLVLCCCVTVGGVVAFYYISKSGSTPIITPAVRTSSVPINNTTDAPTPSAAPKDVTTLLDTFDSNSNDWNVEKTDGEYSVFDEYIKNGKLFFDVTAKKPVLVKDTLWSQTITDFTLSVDTQMVSGPDNADSGLVFRKVDSSNYYLFSICPGKQEFDFAVKKDGAWQEIITWKKSTNINTSGSNTLRVVAEGSKFSLYVNGTLLVEKTNDAITEGGEVGMAADLYAADDHGVISYDNFNLIVK